MANPQARPNPQTQTSPPRGDDVHSKIDKILEEIRQHKTKTSRNIDDLLSEQKQRDRLYDAHSRALRTNPNPSTADIKAQAGLLSPEEHFNQLANNTAPGELQAQSENPESAFDTGDIADQAQLERAAGVQPGKTTLPETPVGLDPSSMQSNSEAPLSSLNGATTASQPLPVLPKVDGLQKQQDQSEKPPSPTGVRAGQTAEPSPADEANRLVKPEQSNESKKEGSNKPAKGKQQDESPKQAEESSERGKNQKKSKEKPEHSDEGQQNAENSETGRPGLKGKAGRAAAGVVSKVPGLDNAKAVFDETKSVLDTYKRFREKGAVGAAKEFAVSNMAILFRQSYSWAVVVASVGLSLIATVILGDILLFVGRAKLGIFDYVILLALNMVLALLILVILVLAAGVYCNSPPPFGGILTSECSGLTFWNQLF